MRLNLVQFQDPPKIGLLSRRFGDDSIIIARDFAPEELVKFRANSTPPAPKTNFAPCMLLTKQDSAQLQKIRKLQALTAIHGSSVEACAFAANQRLDLLINPFTSEKNFLDVQSANVLAQNGTFIAILFCDFLRAEGFARSQLLRNAAMSLKVAHNAGAKILLFSGAQNELEMRASKDLASFGVMLGMKTEDAIKAARGNVTEFMERVK